MRPHEETESYREGFRNGRLDRFLGLRLNVSLTSTWGNYATGYYDGQLKAGDEVRLKEFSHWR